MTIFDNLVYNENSFTELFKNLMRFKVFRREFLSLIDYDFSTENFEFENFTTQRTTSNGRPDLVISTEMTEIFVEIKVWDTVLTNNQPTGYIKELESSNKSNKILILLSPSNYKFLSEYEIKKKESASNVFTQTIFWTDIIDKFDQEEIHDGNPIFHEYRELLREWFEPRKVKIDNKFLEIMYNVNVPDSLIKLSEFISQLKIELQKRNVDITCNKTNILSEFGFYCDKKDSYSLFIGEWFEYWSAKGTPLCITIHSSHEEIKNRFTELCELYKFKKPEYYNNWLTSDINLSIGDDQLGLISDKIYSITDELRKIEIIMK
jgi:hypothetical protein